MSDTNNPHLADSERSMREEAEALAKSNPGFGGRCSDVIAELDRLRARVAELEGALANECQSNVLDNITPEQRERLRHLEGTPDETKLCYLYRGMVRVMGKPKEGDGHNCDEMGCGSCGDHVVMRFMAPSRPYEVTELRRELVRFAEVDMKHMETIAAQAAELERLRNFEAGVREAMRVGGKCCIECIGEHVCDVVSVFDRAPAAQAEPQTSGEEPKGNDR